MTGGLPTINPNNYEDQLFHNNEKMQSVLESLFPELKLPYDAVFQLLSFLQETQINPGILPHVIRGIYNLNIGSGKGQVIVHVQSGITNVQTREQNDNIPLNLEDDKR